MKIRVIWVGRTKDRFLAEVCATFSGRIRHFVGLEIVETREAGGLDERRRVQTDGRRILAAIGDDDFVVALDPAGREFSSESFSGYLGTHMASNPRDLAFVVGPHAGLSEAVRIRADLLCSLSKLTFSHDLARAVLMEQIYRALTMLRNIPYAR